MKKTFLFLIVIILLLSSLSGCSLNYQYTFHSFNYFDTYTTVLGYATSKSEFDSICTKINVMLSEYHKLFDIYNSYEDVGITNLHSINNKATKEPITVDDRITDLLNFAVKLYNITDGKVNIAMGSVLSIWHTHRSEGLNDPENASLPDIAKLKEASLHTDINDIIIDGNSVFLADDKMSLDVGAVAKGYVAEKVAKALESEGITGYSINIGGNVRTIGERKVLYGQKEWSAGIENPFNSEKLICTLKIKDLSLVTSGNYQRYYYVNDEKYHHIIDPQMLMPSKYHTSVSVLCKDSALADGLSTALFNMSYQDGLSLIEKLEGVEVMWVENDGSILYSNGFKN